MAFKDPTDYAFGQLGSIHVASTNAATLIGGVDGSTTRIEKVFVAITFLEDTVFASDSAGLTPEDAQNFPSSNGTSTDIDANAGSVVDGETFPKGVTIYGRWTGFKLVSGRVIAYVGV
tara:strand:+ start:188 stop:541 length:354 start_codon:yes stop_codon:yes gene_type:complete